MSISMSFYNTYNPRKKYKEMPLRIKCSNCNTCSLKAAFVHINKCNVCHHPYPISVRLLPGFSGARIKYFNKNMINSVI